jgi:hypothetical protein
MWSTRHVKFVIYILNKHKICHATLKLWVKNLKYKEPILIVITDRFWSLNSMNTDLYILLVSSQRLEYSEASTYVNKFFPVLVVK